MPIYEYQCSSCQQVSEVTQKFSDAPLTQCPQCGTETLKKLMSLSAISFKGSGYYTTDYKRAAPTPAPAKEAAPAVSSAPAPSAPKAAT